MLSEDGTMPNEASLSEVSIAYVDNGFVIRAMGPGIHKTYVVQAESDHPSEIEGVFDAIRTLHHSLAKGDSDEYSEEKSEEGESIQDSD